MTLATHNPFRSERLRPGTIDYLFADGESIDSLMERLLNNQGRGEIIGPHGTGKSTLIQSLLPRLQALGCQITLGTFQGGQARWTVESRADFQVRSTFQPHLGGRTWKSALPSRVVIIDGFEQLSRLARARWKLYCRLTRRGLIVTAHQPMGLPLLYRTSVSPNLAEQIIERIAGEGCGEDTQRHMAEMLQSHDSNMRDVLFSLYDAYEMRLLELDLPRHKE